MYTKKEDVKLLTKSIKEEFKNHILDWLLHVTRIYYDIHQIICNDKSP